MRKENEFGTVEVGKRADLIILDHNPLEDLSHLLGPRGIIVRGIWMAPEKIDEIMNSIKKIYNSDVDFFQIDPEKNLKLLLYHFRDEQNKNIVKPITYYLFSESLLEVGLKQEARNIMEIAVASYPEEYWLYDQLAKIYVEMNDATKAMLNYRKSLEIYPRGPMARNRIAELEKKD
jgi:tetratricopeptide (TPR) repeat protein